MAGVRVTYELQGLAEAENVLAQLVRRGASLRPLMDELGVYLVSSTIRRFEREVSPAGAPWLPIRRPGKILQDTGLLRDSITHRATDDQVEVGTNRIYAATHQFGATIRPKRGQYLKFKGVEGQDVFVREVTVPARPFLGISDVDEEEIVDIARDYLAEVLA